MASINGVDFSQVAKDALAAAKLAANDEGVWKSLKDVLKNVTNSLKADVEVIAKRKISGEFNENDAGVFLEDQKMLARMRIRSVSIIGLQLAENILNAIADVFKKAINTALGWTVL